MLAGVHRFSLCDPGDVSALDAAIAAGRLIASNIVAVIGKTQGNGLVNDYTRGYLAQSLSLAIARATGETPDAVRKRVPFIFSGGVEGVLSPHYTVFTVYPATAQKREGKRLAIGVAFAADLDPSDIGRQRQIDITADGVVDAKRNAGISRPEDEADRIKAAFVKCEASRDGLVRGKPHTMLNDGDIDQQRHIRAAVGAIVASVLGDTALFVSGGAEHQGPDGGGLVSLIVEHTKEF